MAPLPSPGVLLVGSWKVTSVLGSVAQSRLGLEFQGKYSTKPTCEPLITVNSGRQRVFSRGCPLASDGVNNGASPGGAANIFDLDAVRVTIVGGGDRDRTAPSFAAISTVLAARVVRGAALDKGREDGKTKRSAFLPLASGRPCILSRKAHGRAFL